MPTELSKLLGVLCEQQMAEKEKEFNLYYCGKCGFCHGELFTGHLQYRIDFVFIALDSNC